MSWWKPTPPAPRAAIVEIEKPGPLQATPETASEVASLRSHSGFQFLLRKLALQRARLVAELTQNRHNDLREVEFLQSGLHWCSWLQSQLDFAHERYLATRPSTELENKFFEEISSQIELVGKPQAS